MFLYYCDYYWITTLYILYYEEYLDIIDITLTSKVSGLYFTTIRTEVHNTYNTSGRTRRDNRLELLYYKIINRKIITITIRYNLDNDVSTHAFTAHTRVCICIYALNRGHKRGVTKIINIGTLDRCILYIIFII